MEPNSITDRVAMEAERARLLEAAADAAAKAADIDRQLHEMAELERLAARLNMRVVPADKNSRRFAGASGDILTLGDLIREYRDSALSPYKSLRFSTRRHYDVLLRRIEEHQSVRLDDLDERYIRSEMHDEWTDHGSKNTQMGFALVGMLGRVFRFGAHTLKIDTCAKAVVILQGMAFPVHRAETEELSEEHANLIIQRANEIGRHSIALAQALQFALALHQKDVIGEWIPATDSESGSSDIVFEGKKWVRGIRWEDIDKDLVLKHTTSQGSHRIVADLNRYPLVRRELWAKSARDGELPQGGALIICETTGRPWIANEFRRWWRKIANDVGVKPSVRNAASRKKNARSKETRKDLLILSGAADLLSR